MLNFLLCFLVLCLAFGLYVLVDIFFFLRGLGNEEEAMFNLRERITRETDDN